MGGIDTAYPTLHFDYVSVDPQAGSTDEDYTLTVRLGGNVLKVSALHETSLIQNANIILIPEGEIIFRVLGADKSLLPNSKITLEAE